MLGKNMELKEVASRMAELDICMMTTVSPAGVLTSRPMSNNGDVEYDGNSYFFTNEQTHLIGDIEKNKQVNLAFEANDGLYISVSGTAGLVRSQKQMKEHWNSDLDEWFSEGVNTPGLVMIHVKANRIKYWQDEKEGEVKL
jgi:general stress protein 26